MRKIGLTVLFYVACAKLPEEDAPFGEKQDKL